MKLSELIVEVNKDIDDDLDADDITKWLNRAIDDLSPVATYQKTATIAVVSGTQAYTLPSDFIKVFALQDLTVDPEAKLNPLDIRNFNQSGYKIWGNEISILPLPTADKTLTLYYYATLPHLALPDDVPVIRSDFHDLLVLYAVARAKYQDDEEGMKNNAMDEYFSRKQQFMRLGVQDQVYQIEDVFGCLL